MKNFSKCTRWLEIVIKERFGIEISITRSQYRLDVALVNFEGVIVFDRPLHIVHANGATLWDSHAEGFSSARRDVLPAPGAVQLPSPLIEFKEGNSYIHYDILGLTYWMLTRQEEVESDALDEHGRFPATASHAYRHGYLERPIVDEWLDILGQVMKRQWPGLQLKRHAFEMKVSHDVDSASEYAFTSWQLTFRRMAGDVIKRRSPGTALTRARIKACSGETLHPKDPHNTFSWLMDRSDEHGLTSAFYFICGRTDSARDARYNPEHPAIRHLMRTIHDRGHEVGLHPSYNTYQRPDEIVREAQRLRRICEEEGIRQPQWGGRMHFLRWDQSITLKGWERAGLDYDSTMSYADLPGFRCGTCFEYPAFDPIDGVMLNLRIRPLIAMECTVVEERYLGLGAGEAAYEKFSVLKAACRSVQGCFTLLWHNSNLYNASMRALYQRVLAD